MHHEDIKQLTNRLEHALNRIILTRFKGRSITNLTLPKIKEKAIPDLVAEFKKSVSMKFDYQVELIIISKFGIAIGETKSSKMFGDFQSGEFRKEYQFEDFILMSEVFCRPI